ncbi:hypothetical protein VP1G_08021 [Cytospora mali]|uniref:Uncharacterized protein n=1 Tax=Cytospora mali TaxID=578113 RepID=A0A194VA38_CYTMA|nr:hypothetical protein VP1G_08021 [Valsa mali var. pyri (nom. inval.)]
MGSTAVAGKFQIARSWASGLSCPSYQGESMHHSAAKAASVGVSSGQNEARYQRMWLSKLTRTGLLFPEESRPATAGFSGFGGSSSTSTSCRGSTSSVASVSSGLGTSPSVASSGDPDEIMFKTTSSLQQPE